MSTTVTNSPSASRYELTVDGEPAGIAEYRLSENEIVFTHTEVDTERRENGLGGDLVRHALDDVRANSTKRVVASCPFVSSWIGDHPEYQDLLTR
ncbi:MAG TPA: GNAT family N-acetyltransferase [Glaciihabitans sp.]|jgi:predicted GNAT family acetyltransferase|nr:GNAT family N-acetyltransferase [Glaciihabitans sp.]